MLRTPTLIVLFLGVLTSIAVASSAPTFCKCICFSNYTIIPLGPQHDADNPNNPPSPSVPGSGSDSDDGSAPSSSSAASDDELGLAGGSNSMHKQTRSPLDDFPQDDLDLMHKLNDELRHSRGGSQKPRVEKRCPDASSEAPSPSHKSRRDRFSPLDLLPRLPDLSSISILRLGAQSAVERRSSSTSCNECNRAFCLSYNLPICKDAEEKDVQTMCFQRDSRKDQIIVWLFILGTGGLLGWAGVRRLLELRESRRGTERRRQEIARGMYRPVGDDRTPRESES